VFVRYSLSVVTVLRVHKPLTSVYHATTVPALFSATTCLKPRLHQGNMWPSKMLHVAGNVLPVSRQHVSLCSQQQTDKKLATILTATSKMLPWCKRGFTESFVSSVFRHLVYFTHLPLLALLLFNFIAHHVSVTFSF